MNNNQLVTIVNEIQTNPQKKDVILEAYQPSLQSEDFLILAGWDTGSSFFPSLGKLELDFPNGIILVSSSNDQRLLEAQLVGRDQPVTVNMKPVITYNRSKYVVAIKSSSPFVPQRTYEHSFLTLILALYLVQYKVDSALLWPTELRKQEFERLAKILKVDSSYFVNLSKWFPAISPYVFKVL